MVAHFKAFLDGGREGLSKFITEQEAKLDQERKK
jgi:hypothetical protein